MTAHLNKNHTHYLIIIVCVLAFFSAVPHSVSALEITVDRTGTVSFYDDGVLGIEDDRSEKEEEREKESKKEESRFEKQEKREEKEIKREYTEEKREVKKDIQREEKKPSRTFPATQKRRLEITPTNDVLTVAVSEKNASESQPQMVEAKRLRAQLKFNTTSDRSASELESESELENENEPENEIENETDNEKMREDKKRAAELEAQYRKKLAEERRRQDDGMEVKSVLDEDGAQELEIQNKTVRARLRGASFAFDPAANAITLTTPSGNTHTLNHLPDQAVERMRSILALDATHETTVGEIEVLPTDEGAIYQTKAVKTKRLFGLFERNIPTTITLDDTTGEVSTLEEKTPGIWGQLLDAFTR